MSLIHVFLVVLALTGSARVNADKEHAAQLIDIFEEFKNLLPADVTDLIFFQYLFTDKEFQDTANYVQTNEFKDFVRKVDSNSDIVNLYEYLEEAGMDAYAMMNEMHDFLGLPHIAKRNRRDAQLRKITGGMDGFVKDIRAIYPKDKIAALHKKKLETSPVFARFVELIKAPRFRELLDAVEANAELQQLFRVAKSGGVDVKAVAGLLLEMWGIELPPKA